MAVVEASLADAAFAKINLTLRVLGRRADGYHELESLVAFASVGDMVRLATGGPLALDVDGPQAAACGVTSDNLVLKAANALASRVDGLRLGRFLLTKELPVASGIGGGSADAAAALRLLVHANRDVFPTADFTDPGIHAAALATGADVPVCLEGKARIMFGIGERLAPPLKLPPLPAVLVNPGVPLATKDVFGRFKLGVGDKPPSGDVPTDIEGLLGYLAHNGNDLTKAAIACAPVVATVLDTIGAQRGVRLARMSGSGATCFGLFDTAQNAAAAAEALKAAHRDWWVVPTRFA